MKNYMKNYSRVLRDFIIEQNKVNAKFNPLTAGWNIRSDYQELMTYNTVRAMYKLSTENFVDEKVMDNFSMECRCSEIMPTMCLLSLFVDMYKILNLREKLDIINDIDAILLDKMRNASENGGFDVICDILLDAANMPLMVQALGFSDLSIYDKILQIKALDDKDLEVIRRIFPLFEDLSNDEENVKYQGEYDAYNVEVDENFMIRQMKKRSGPWKDNPEKCYEDAANFLDQYSILNNSLYKQISKTTGHTNLDDTKGMLKKLINQ